MPDFLVYTDLDSLFDTRRAVIESLLPEGETWEEHYADRYAKRTIDNFDRPEMGITQEKYLEAFQNRSLELFHNTVYPTRLLSKTLSIILDVENFIGKPINVATIRYHVNIWPYVIPDDLKKTLQQSIEDAIFYNKEVTLVSYPPEALLPDYFRKFTHVFKYDMLGEQNKAFMTSIHKHPIPSVKFFVPDLYIKNPDTGFLAEPEEVIHKMSVVLGASLTLIPMRHMVYDYRNLE